MVNSFVVSLDIIHFFISNAFFKSASVLLNLSIN